MSSKTKDELNGLLAQGFAEIASLIPENPAKAASLARAFSRMVHLTEDGIYDWYSALGWLAAHYGAYPAGGTDKNFLQAWERLRKLS